MQALRSLNLLINYQESGMDQQFKKRHKCSEINTIIERFLASTFENLSFPNYKNIAKTVFSADALITLKYFKRINSVSRANYGRSLLIPCSSSDVYILLFNTNFSLRKTNYSLKIYKKE